MTKLLFKLFKYGCLIYLLIFIKDLYSEDTANDKKIETYMQPSALVDIADFNDPFSYDDNEQGYDQEVQIFSEQMEYYRQKNLKKYEKKAKVANNNTVKEYKKSLEQGLLLEDKSKLEDQEKNTPESVSESNSSQEPLRQLRTN